MREREIKNYFIFSYFLISLFSHKNVLLSYLEKSITHKEETKIKPIIQRLIYCCI